MAQFKIIYDLSHDSNGITTCVDLTGVFPLVGLGTRTFTVGQTALEVASSQVTKHEKVCFDNQHFLCHLYLTLLVS